MHREPLISVIVYIYDNVEYLEKCLKTLLLQTYKNLEIICINNGGKEKVSGILSEYEQKDDRIKIFNQEYTDSAKARNEGLNLARGEYISFINACDWVSLDLYQVFVNKLNTEDVDIYMFNASLFSDVHVDIPDYEFFDQEDIFNNEENAIHTYKDIYGILFKNNLVVNKIYKKSFLENNNIRFLDGKNFSEYLFNIKALLTANKIIINDEAYYRCVKNIMWEYPNPDGVFDIFDITEEILKVIKEENIFYPYQVEFLRFICSVYKTCFILSPENLKRGYFSKMRSSFNSYLYSMTPDAQVFVQGIKDVLFMLNSTFEEFNSSVK